MTDFDLEYRARALYAWERRIELLTELDQLRAQREAVLKLCDEEDVRQAWGTGYGVDQDDIRAVYGREAPARDPAETAQAPVGPDAYPSEGGEVPEAPGAPEAVEHTPEFRTGFDFGRKIGTAGFRDWLKRIGWVSPTAIYPAVPETPIGHVLARMAHQDGDSGWIAVAVPGTEHGFRMLTIAEPKGGGSDVR